MGVILDMNYRVWENNTDAVGWPTPKPPTEDSPLGYTNTLYQYIIDNAAFFRSCGFTAINFPPSVKGAAGLFSDGYDLMGNNYDLGSLNSPTAFGDIHQLRQAVASCHAVGMQAYGDLVMHQYDGFDPTQIYYPPGATLNNNGRFPKLPSYFVGPPPGVEVDPVPDSSGNFGFGAMASYINSTPTGQMLSETVAAAEWLAYTTDFDGFRIDDVKGTNWDAVLAVLNSSTLKNKFAFGEYFDGNCSALWNWVNTLMGRRSACLDFNFKFNVGNICNNNSKVWMGNLASTGYCLVDPYMAVTFCESADTDNSPGEQIVWNKILGYALMLTYPGYPRVYFRDWSTNDNCYGMMNDINNLIYIHENFANGAFVPRLDNDPQVFIMERTGQPGCIAAFNNDQYNEYTRTVQTSFGPNQRLHEYTGKAGDLWTDYAGRLTITVPKNNNGFGFLVYAVWVEPVPYPVVPIYTTQTVIGAVDLACNPPIAVGTIDVARFFIKEGTYINISGIINSSDWTMTEFATIYIKNSKNLAIGSMVWKSNSDGNIPNHGFLIDQTGYYYITIESDVLLATPYSLTFNYLAG